MEVKWFDNPRTGKLRQFMLKNDLKRGIVTSKTIFDNTADILIVSNSIYAYVVSKNALEKIEAGEE